MIEYIIIFVLVVFVSMCFTVYLVADKDYYYTSNDGIYYHCYDGSDYLLCDVVGDGMGYD